MFKKPSMLTGSSEGILSRSEMKSIIAGGSGCYQGDPCACSSVYNCYASECSYQEGNYPGNPDGTYEECINEVLGLWEDCDDFCSSP